MRIGINPEKFNKEILIENYHRVIVPVFIPHFDGYFAQLLDIFKLCLESLLLTSHTITRVTIYNNNSHSEKIHRLYVFKIRNDRSGFSF